MAARSARASILLSTLVALLPPCTTEQIILGRARVCRSLYRIGTIIRSAQRLVETLLLDCPRIALVLAPTSLLLSATDPVLLMVTFSLVLLLSTTSRFTATRGGSY